METANSGYSRTMDEVRNTLELATIKESDLKSVTQILYSAEDHNIDKHIKLLEIDDHLIEMINKGDVLTFQGNEEDSVVLCTKNRTYDVKESETSNSCLLVPNASMFEKTKLHTGGRIIKDNNILGIFHTYFEVKECKPKLEKLLDLLGPTSFKGMEYESSIPQELLYDWSRLQSEIQASEEELRQALNDYLIVNIDGYFRLISFESEVRSLTLMLDLFDENSWELDEVDREITYDYLKEFIHKSVFDTLFAKYTEVSDKFKEDGSCLYRYNEEHCCKSLAKVLLAASSITDYTQFMESWNIGTPEKMKPKDEYLRGIALIIWNSLTMKKEVIAFPETDLPKNTDERFNALFKAKDKWTVEEITPYILCLATSKINVNALLTKYARSSVINGIKYYSSKHGK
ncbi:sister chromatid cohesion protein DCC1 isoform X1 [Megachile rotundata]|uniref:sister chromatid cohesion protein DCC1 isoform X1 n=3 Tax=Megachile rotundata TaxID=143995 RepID=UPI000258F537|nr:PREDICTED: sister chromatid cohesion protein DCC1 isoform X1 [Megachile rotundata]